MQQREQLYRADSALRAYFAGRSDVLVSGEGYLRKDPYDPSEQLAPDCVVAYGVKPEAIIGRNGYVINEVGKPPDFVLEVASRSTGRQDYIAVFKTLPASERVKKACGFRLPS